MALRASYYGLKKRVLDKVLGDYDTDGVMTNKELTDTNANIYSTTEKVVGKWVTGKPLYQRTWITTVPTTSTDGTDETESFNIDADIVLRDSSSGILNESTGAFNPIPAIDYNNSSYRATWYVGSTHNVIIRNNKVSHSGRTLYITLRYTKSSD